ncbi:ABC transporter permease [Savagea sp. SN6]|uniref:ABC transporter permease n=1 Tax=Savagea serpentis TaxID=2785297 RepID=A0A8J7KT88_9BACL|nr:ABC transporter permease [Savagea serpentis]MBF4501309.1 ABC transporter permease [Savagea serpentis]
MTFRQFAYRNVIRNRRIYAAFFMASVFSVMVFFLYSMLLFHPSIEDSFLQEIAFVGMGLAEVTLYIFTLFFLFYSMRAFLQARSKEFGILIHLGMAKKQLSKLIFLETMLIGVSAIGVGTFLGFLFSKFFFMIVREIVRLPALPFYFAWQPFALTVGAFLSLFAIIAFIAPSFIRTERIEDLLDEVDHQTTTHSTARAYLGMFLLASAYASAALTNDELVIGLIFLLPPIATLGTYYFFTDSLPFLFELLRSRKSLYWRHFNLLSINEGIARLKENARMFFIVTIVSTVAFMSVGILASLTSFASQYREVNPLGIVYKSELDNPFEYAHVTMLEEELQEQEIGYTLVPFTVLKQTSSMTTHDVTILKESDVNALARASYTMPLQLEEGEARFLPATATAAQRLDKRVTQTELMPSQLPVTISGVYGSHLFPANAHGLNAIILNDHDYERIRSEVPKEQAVAYTYYAFHIDEWQETTGIGTVLSGIISGSVVNDTYIPFTFENPGANYSILRTTFSLLLFIGLLLAGVLFLAAGSFIYFKLYTSLERDKAEFDVLRRLGMTDREFKRIVNRQLMPQFFFPWGVALLHSAFAFMSLQVIWDVLAEISIAKEMFIVLAGFTILQFVYFYLIRWRYLSHVRSSSL